MDHLLLSAKQSAGVTHLVFQRREDMTRLLLRPQEFYESEFSDIRGQVFSREQFRDRYAPNGAEFTYYTDWVGFNIPGPALVDFANRFAGVLEKQEVLLLDRLQHVLEKPHANYLIATAADVGVAIEHELAHAWFFLDAEYRERQLAAIRELPADFYRSASAGLAELGYGQNVEKDEIQAYASTETDAELEARWGWTSHPAVDSMRANWAEKFERMG